MAEKKLLTRGEAAAYLGISTRTLDRMTHERKIAYVKLGGKILFLPDDLDAYIAAQRVSALRPTLPGGGTYRRRRSVSA